MQKLWLDWTDEADAEGFTDFYGLQRRAAREVFIAGEVFFRFRPRRPQDGLSGAAAAADAPLGDAAAQPQRDRAGGNVIRQGIEFDAIGRRVAYHFLRRHPGDMTDPRPCRRDRAHPGLRDRARHRSGRCRSAARRLPLRSRHREAVPARSVRRRRARPEEGRGDARALHHDAGADRTARCGGRARRERRAHHRPAAGPDHHAGARRGGADLGAGRRLARPTSRSSTARFCRSRPRWACRTRICPTTCSRRTTRTRAWRCSNSVGASKPTSMP